MNRFWRSAPLEHSVWTRWDDVHVVYHRPSGKTHVLNDAAAELLHHVLTTPKTAESAAADLAARQGHGSDELPIEHIALVLAHLEQLGLALRS